MDFLFTDQESIPILEWFGLRATWTSAVEKRWTESERKMLISFILILRYAYYVTVDFPYVLQCYRGETSSTFRNGEQFQGSGNCAANNEGCSPGNMAIGGTGGPSGRPAGPPGRKRRDVKDPTESWFNELEYLSSLGNISSYSGEILSKVGSRRRRSVATLSAAIDDVIAAGDARFTKNIYLKHLSYQCNSCNGARDLNVISTTFFKRLLKLRFRQIALES